MKFHHESFRPQTAMLAASAIAVLMFATNLFSSTPTKVLYSFTGATGESPNGALVADAAGNLYGTTSSGGVGNGTVFELSPPATVGGAWSESVLYSFQGSDTDGAYPYGTLTFDKVGNLYGTTNGGGPDNRGTVFKLSPPATSGGTWTETAIFIFPSDLHSGYGPLGKLAFDGAGNLYGTAQNGGPNVISCDCGTLFELTPPATPAGSWTPAVLHNFGATSGDALNPVGDLTFRNGVIYGMTQHGGSGGQGTIFQMVRSHGAWSMNILKNFDSGVDGGLPDGGLTFDAGGNIYGVTVVGGSGYGVVFELSPPSVTGSAWQYGTLYVFSKVDGQNPVGPLVFDTGRNLYGTTRNGGLKNPNTSNNGIVFELSPATGGAWTETTLHRFGGTFYGDGSQPQYGLIFSNGKLYGTTSQGGTVNLGTVFSVVP